MPASGEVLLDTSVVIPFLKGDQKIRAQLREEATIYLPQIVLGELYCGLFLSAQPEKNKIQIQNLLEAMTVLSSGISTAKYYGEIRAALSKAGQPIPENDIWIAAIALEHQLPLAARDAHFDHIPNLKILKW
jgi:tRNA(fMet)-specific endonuclease VapC